MTESITHRQRRQRGALRLEAAGWVLRIRDDQSAPDGMLKRTERRIPVGQWSSKAQARRAADALLARLNPNGSRIGSGTTVAQFAEIFLSDRVTLMKPSSALAARSAIRKHIAPTLGHFHLDQLGDRAPQLLVNSMNAAGCSRKTAKNVVSVLSGLMRLARRYGHACPVLARDAIALPPASIEVERRFFSPTESGKILSAAPYPWRALYALLAFTGMRIGEALGLTWQHVNIEASLLHIRQSCVFGRIQTTKSKGSAVDLAMPDALREILTLHNRKHWPSNPTGLLFATEDGRPLLSSEVRAKQLHPLLDQLSIARGGFHAFRHGHATNLFSVGASAPTVRGILRHSDLHTTLKYTHTIASDQRDAAERVANRITVAGGNA